MPSIAETLAQQLHEAGARRVYGLPGGENVDVLDALWRRDMQFILVANESSACFMAAAEARLTGGIGVALTTLGPGASNACAGLTHACLDRAPVLLITAASDPALRDKHSHQALDLQTLFAPICKLSAELAPAGATAVIQQVLRLMRTGRPGPAHLSLPSRLASLPCPAAATSHPSATPAPQNPPLREVRALLADKRKPIIVLGLGLEPSRPYAQIRQLAESLGSPVIDTPKSKGALSAAHPLFAGTIGLTRSDPAYALLDEADCIIALGFDVVELVKPWDYETPLLWVADWHNHDPKLDCAIEVVGDIGKMLAALGKLTASTAADWGAARVRRLREGLAARSTPKAAAGRISPQDFLASLREHSPTDIIVTSDVGSHKIFAALEWQPRQPNRYLVSNGLSAMGYGLCSAIAAAHVMRQPVVCITGDAGLAMVMGELGLLPRLGLSILVAVMNDSALDLIRSAQRRRGVATVGTEFVNPDYRQVAAAYGLAYQRVESRADCDAGIQSWLRQGGAMLLDVLLDPAGYPTSAGCQHSPLPQTPPPK
ncbi:MAG: thiamine pyrophosphate-binding protein [Chloroflexi bacterium]|nr:thiamine pyrophosphate-binding protein [Chloroflexota bacterium]MCY3715988.1 thiamine pyrophosphate-binding protein [Chloroflexota bacterium]MYA93357.1 thiamine pyrophosphate-binding protein [Chloroflexota bacterium]MYC56098.1 thiamine pyrophosphate-binding protein [Chloroflexota bacterium]